MLDKRHPHSHRLATAALVALCLTVPRGALAYEKTFAPNSLIIPTGAEYQTDCGLASAYGLIYTILYLNASLPATTRAVTIYWVVEPKKLSHHRCNTDTDDLPDYTKYNDNDGCDFAVQGIANQPPVTILNNDNSTPNPPTFTVAKTLRTGARSGTAVIDKNRKVTKYSGGAWVIDATDRATVLNMLATSPLLKPYRNGGVCNTLPVAVNGSHQTSIHTALSGFKAPIARMANSKPPLIALMSAKYVSILKSYLQNAGLNFANAGGTPAAHGLIYDTLIPLTDFVSTPTDPIGKLNMLKPDGSNIYQVMWAPHWEYDTDSKLPIDGDPGDDVLGDAKWTHNGEDPVTNAFKNLAAFADAGYGIFAECASIASIEGAYSSILPTCNSGQYECECTDSTDTPVCSPFGSVIPYVAPACPVGYTKYCVEQASQVLLPGFPDTRFQATDRFAINYLSGGNAGATNYFNGPDCTESAVADPPSGTSKYRLAFAGDCLNYWPATGGPGNMFAQVGNYGYKPTYGHTGHYKPADVFGSVYRPSTLHFITSANATNPLREGWDFATARYKDNDPSKGMIVYLAGHTYADAPAGNRVVLNTLLNLGFSDVGIELARSEPVGYVTWGKDGAGNPMVLARNVFQGTYQQRAPPGPYQDWINFNPAVAHSWRFPYIDGHMRAYDLDSISTAGQDFKTNALWDAAANIPSPPSRKIFTMVNGNANLGWKKIDFKYTETDPLSCHNYGGVLDAKGQKACDLSYALTQCGSTAGVTQAKLLADSKAVASTLGSMVQQVRGHCAAHSLITGAPFMEPADAQCDDFRSVWQRNRARLGGVDHSSPAIVGPTPYIKDVTKPDGTIETFSNRPVVAFFGARDGMLHATYVSGGTGFAAGGVSLAAGTAAGTELWAFLPPGQLCGLSTNSAMVDANVSVMDVFGDFPRDANNDGVFDFTDPNERPNGTREWRTVLVSTAGEGAAEIFALDVTNPLKPVLLWHVDGKSNHDDRFDMNGNGTFSDASDHMDKDKPATYAIKWPNWQSAAPGVADPTKPNYNATDKPTLDAMKLGRYDYRNLGYAYGTAIGTLWQGRSFQWVVYLATNAADYTSATPLGITGLELFAIDVVTGQKIWQWENQYRRASVTGVIADNGIPGRPALVDVNNDGSVDRVYVGDLEGRMWELSAADGKNLNYLPMGPDSVVYKSFPFYGTPAMSSAGVDAITQLGFTPLGSAELAQEPLTSPIGIGRFTSVPPTLMDALQGRIAVAQGTMGVDWAITPFEPGHVYVVPAYPEGDVRLPTPIDPSVTPDPAIYGVLKRANTTWVINLNVGERVFGMPKIIGNDIFINTSYGSFAGDITSSIGDQGRTLRVNTTNPAGTQVDTSLKRYGGVLVFGTDVIITSDSGISKVVNAAPGNNGSTGSKVPSQPWDRFAPAAAKTWEQLPDGSPPFLK